MLPNAICAGGEVLAMYTAQQGGGGGGGGRINFVQEILALTACRCLCLLHIVGPSFDHA